MTVCVAALSQYQGNSVIVGATDRMVTSGDVEFEQEQPKIVRLTTAISLLAAGDLSIQAAVLHRVRGVIDELIAGDPTSWLLVKDIAELFYSELATFRNARARAAILDPLGLTVERLVSSAVSHEMATQLAKELLDFQLPPIEAIIMGIDPTGAHVYEVNNTGVQCQDWTGFASIGAGAWHASSQLMFGGQTKQRSIAETLMLVYTAKKRAEVAPGVGEQTDMLVIGPGLGEQTLVGGPLLVALHEEFTTVVTEAEKVRANANSKINTYFEEIVGQTSTSEQSVGDQEFPPDPASRESRNEEAAREDTVQAEVEVGAEDRNES